jgi:hypothetical protein
MAMTDRLVEDGYAAAGYNQISIDDCWSNFSRDSDGRLQPDHERFPSGMKALGDYMHNKGVRFGLYADEGNLTCTYYPGSLGYEEIDAETSSEWGVDYLKLGGCADNAPGRAAGYPKFGAALQKTGEWCAVVPIY